MAVSGIVEIKIEVPLGILTPDSVPMTVAPKMKVTPGILMKTKDREKRVLGLGCPR